MLLRALFLIFVFSLLTEIMLTATALFSKVVLYERALSYIPAGYQLGLAAISQSFNSGTYTAAAPAPPVCVSNDLPCTFFAAQTITEPAQTPPVAAAPCGGTSLTNCAVNLQKQVIDETRLGLQLAITVFDANKHPLVTRTKYLTLRTFGVAPYFALIGERDGASGDRSDTPEGENAGLSATASQGSTQIKVLYHDTTGKNPDTEHDTWATQGWSSGNAASSAWSP